MIRYEGPTYPAPLFQLQFLIPDLNLEYKNYVFGLERGFEEDCLDLENVSSILMEVRSVSIGLLIRPVRSALHSTLTNDSLAMRCVKAETLRRFHCPTCGTFSLMGFKIDTV